MAYHTGVPSKATPHSSQEKVYEDKEGYSAYSWGGRIFLYKSGYRVAELVNGFDTLKKKYRGSFEVLIHKIREKDLEKLETIKGYIEDLQKDIETIKSIHGFVEE